VGGILKLSGDVHFSPPTGKKEKTARREKEYQSDRRGKAKEIDGVLPDRRVTRKRRRIRFSPSRDRPSRPPHRRRGGKKLISRSGDPEGV